MPFGLCNAPSTFQRLMEHILQEELWKFRLTYIDDIIIFSPNFEKHLEHIEIIFKKLREVNLILKASKCNFAKESTAFLGHIVNGDGIQPNNDNVSAVKDYPRPSNAKEARSLSGLVSY